MLGGRGEADSRVQSHHSMAFHSYALQSCIRFFFSFLSGWKTFQRGFVHVQCGVDVEDAGDED